MITTADFLSIPSIGQYKRVSATHPLDLYIGKDNNGRYSFEYKGTFEPNKKVRSTDIIDVGHYRINSDTSIVLSLKDEKSLARFCSFCDDICEQTKSLPKGAKQGYVLVCNVYFAWQKMFKTQNEKFSEEKIKGLMGELLFLRDVMIPMYGVDDSILSWSGPEKMKKDFSIGNTWYEIKTIDAGKPSVGISSIEQLESTTDGELVVFQLEKMSAQSQGITLNSLIDDIQKQILSVQIKDVFFSKLEKLGYHYNVLYDDYVYNQNKMVEYIVDASFPRMKKNVLPSAIIKASYELDLNELESYKK
ncbi:MAG: PD-(D/E)XK motif protein [Bacteroidales bacterium]|nr:PD-(D/E)XK motif protein [Bacteroidales bacterium]